MDFLRVVSSINGHNLVGWLDIPNKAKNIRWETCSFASDFDIERATKKVSPYGYDIFFALAASSDPDVRGKHTPKVFRSLWADIDAGPDKLAKHGEKKVYKTQDEALEAVVAAGVSGALPVPTYIVSSGAGLHVYWAFDNDIAEDEWKPLAKTMAQKLAANGIKYDPARAVDVSSVLRVPGTMHSGTNTPVTIRFAGDIYQLDALRAQIGASAFVPSTSPDLPPSYVVPQGMAGLTIEESNAPKSFRKILMLSHINNTGCQQITNYINNRADHADYNEWRAILSIAANCDDSQEFIHSISDPHPNYSPAETEHRASETRGKPYTCESMELYMPGGCAGCPHSGRIKSPVVLGLKPESLPEVVTIKGDDDEQTPIEIVIPEPPFPYYRKDGKVYVDEVAKVVDEFGVEVEDRVPVKICDFDFYLYDRNFVRSTSSVEFLARIHSPHDGIIEFKIPAANIASPNTEATRTLLANHNLILSQAGYTLMGKYLQKQAERLINQQQAKKAIVQFGWQEDETFIWGDTQYTKRGPVPAPGSENEHMQELCKATSPRGTLAEWSSLIQEMYGGDDAGTHRMQMALLLGSPIAAFCSSDPGGIVHAYSAATGQGKTFAYSAAYRALLSFENTRMPSMALIQGSNASTPMAMVKVMGMMNSLPLVWDEVSTVDQRLLGDVAYQATQGRTKLRLEQTGDLRGGVLDWQSPLMTTANKSLVQTLAGYGQSEAQMARVFEFQVKIPRALEQNQVGASHLERLKLRFNAVGGVLAKPYFDYLVKHRPSVQKLWSEMFDAFCGVVNPTTQERFVTNLAVQALVFSKLAYDQGWWPFSPAVIYDEVVKHFRRGREMKQELNRTSSDILADFMNEYQREALIFQTENMLAGVQVTHPVAFRIEHYSKTLYITQAKLRAYCKDYDLDLMQVEDLIKSLGGQLRSKRPTTGTIGSSYTGAIKMWVIDGTHPEAAKYFALDLEKPNG